MTLHRKVRVDGASEWFDFRTSWTDLSPDSESSWLVPEDCFSQRNRRAESSSSETVDSFVEIPDTRLQHLSNSIEKAKWITQLQPNWDDEGATLRNPLIV